MRSSTTAQIVDLRFYKLQGIKLLFKRHNFCLMCGEKWPLKANWRHLLQAACWEGNFYFDEPSKWHCKAECIVNRSIKRVVWIHTCLSSFVCDAILKTKVAQLDQVSHVLNHKFILILNHFWSCHVCTYIMIRLY